MIRFFFFFWLFPLFVQAQGIEFRPFERVSLSREAQQNKQLIFIEVSAGWCANCKKMDKHVFPLPEVGTYYNNHFICTQIDRDSPEGEALAERYRVDALPCFLFIDASERLIFKAVGATTQAQDFNNYGKTAIALWASPSPQDSLTLRQYALYLLENGAKDSAAVYYERYLQTQPLPPPPPALDLTTAFIAQNMPSALAFFWAHQTDFEQHKGAGFTLMVRWQCIENELNTIMPTDRSKWDMFNAKPVFERYFPADPHRQWLQYQLRFYQERLDFKALRPVVFQFVTEIAQPAQYSDDFLQSAAILYQIAESTDRATQDYQTALHWARTAEQLKPCSQVYNLLFDIYAAQGNEKEALAAQALAKEHKMKGN